MQILRLHSLKSNLTLLFALLLTLVMLSACSTKLKTIKDDAPVNIKMNEGYLMVGLDTNANLNKIRIAGRKSVTFTRQDLRVGSNFILTTVPAGEYHFKRIVFQQGYRNLDEVALKFTIEPGKINYVGNIELRQNPWSWYSTFLMLNQTSMALEFLQESFPKMLATNKVRYGGPGKDNFFNVIGDKPLTSAAPSTEIQQEAKQ